MKRSSFVSHFLLLGIFLFVLFNVLSYFHMEANLMESINSELDSDVNNKSEKIEDYVSDLKNDIEFLSKSDEIKVALDDEVKSFEELAINDVDSKKRSIFREVENYILAYPDMTLSELQNSAEFQRIAVSQVGKNGYTFVFDSDSLICYFHKENRRIGFDYHEMKDSFPELWSLFEGSTTNGTSEGFYYRDEVDGNISYKYVSILEIPTKTADGISLSVAVTAYLDDYKALDSEIDFLEDFSSEYKSVFLIDSDGYVIYVSGDEERLGINVEWEESWDYGVSVAYFDSFDKKDVSFSGPFMDEYGSVYPEFYVVSPVYDSGKLLGYVVLEEDMKDIYDIMDYKSLDDERQSYIVNYDELLISPLNGNKFGIMLQSVKTEGVENYLEEGLEQTEHLHTFRAYLDYKGEQVYGTHYYVDELDWCVVSEINKKSSLQTSSLNMLVKNIYMSLIVLCVVLLLGVGFNDFFVKKMTRKSKSKLYSLKKHALRFAFFAFFVLLFTYVFGVPKSISYVGLIPDVVCIVALSVALSYFINKSKIKYKRVVIFGILLCILAEIIQVIIEGHLFEESVFSNIWTVISSVAILGTILILYGFREAVK